MRRRRRRRIFRAFARAQRTRADRLGDQGLPRQGKGARRPRRRCSRIPRLDAEMRAMASAELAAAEAECRRRWPRRSAFRSCRRTRPTRRAPILEVRAGTGGDEAALFAGDLFRMYQRYAESKGWKVEIAVGERRRRPAATRKSSPRSPARRVRAAQIRVRRASRAARAGDRGAGAHPHLGGDRRGAAGGRGGRRRDQRERTSRSTPCARAAPAASTSTRPNRRSASPICRPASSSACRTSARSTRTAPRRWRSCARAFSRPSDAEARRRARRRPAHRRSARAIARSASAPIISRKGASPIIAST